MIYDSIKEYLDKYLFGFDQSQLECSVLSGNVNLKGVNLRPDKANQLIKSLGLPFQMKAGTIGNLQIKINYFQMWARTTASSAVEVQIQDLYLILGPNLSQRSRDESFYQEEQIDELLLPYDESNMFNIFQNELQVKRKPKNLESADNNRVSEDTLTNMRSLNLIIKKLHIRYEDDYYCREGKPYSCGIVVNELKCETSHLRQVFNGFQKKFQEVLQSGPLHLIKNFQLSGLRAYWNCVSEMFIPTSLLDQTESMKYQIFEAMEASQIAHMMARAFSNSDNQYILQSVNCNFQNEYEQTSDCTNQRMVLEVESKLRLRLNPYMVEDMISVLQRMQQYYLIRDLKQYRPHRKPIVDQQVPHHFKKNSVLRHKRKLIARDWFFYAVWAIRLKKITAQINQKPVMDSYLIINPKYSLLLKKCLDERVSFEQVRQLFTERIGADVTSFCLQFRLNQPTEIEISKRQLFEATPQDPKFLIDIGVVSFDLKSQPSKTISNCYIQSFDISLLVKMNNQSLQQGKSLQSMKLLAQMQEDEQELRPVSNQLMDDVVQTHHIPNVTSPSRLMTATESQMNTLSVVSFFTDLFGGFKHRQDTERETQPKQTYQRTQVGLDRLINPRDQVGDKQMMQSRAIEPSVRNQNKIIGSNSRVVNQQRFKQVEDSKNCKLSHQIIQKLNNTTSIVKRRLLTFGNESMFNSNYQMQITTSKSCTFTAKTSSLQISYTTDVLQHMFEIVEACKKLPNFRDVNFCFTSPSAQVQSNMLNHIFTKFYLRSRKDNEVQKWTFFNQQLKTQNFDFNINAERIYVSLFNSLTLDQVAKFVSPDIIIGLKKTDKECIVNFLGFQLQTSTEIPVLQTFLDCVSSQVNLIKQSEALKTGFDFYKKIHQDYKQRISEKLMQKQKPTQTKGLMAVRSNNFFEANKMRIKLPPQEIIQNKGMIKQLKLEGVPGKDILCISNEDEIIDPESDLGSEPSSLKKSKSQGQFSTNFAQYRNRVAASENDSGGAICREEMADLIKQQSKPRRSSFSNYDDDLGIDEHAISSQVIRLDANFLSNVNASTSVTVLMNQHKSVTSKVTQLPRTKKSPSKHQSMLQRASENTKPLFKVNQKLNL